MSASAFGRLLTAHQSAEHLGISEHKVRRLVRDRAITAMRHESGRLLGIYEHHLDAWRSARLAPAVSTPTATGPERIAHLLPKKRYFAG